MKIGEKVKYQDDTHPKPIEVIVWDVQCSQWIGNEPHPSYQKTYTLLALTGERFEFISR